MYRCSDRVRLIPDTDDGSLPAVIQNYGHLGGKVAGTCTRVEAVVSGHRRTYVDDGSLPAPIQNYGHPCG